MARIALLTVQWGLLGLAAYTIGVSIAGWRTPTPAPIGSRDRRLVVVIPAHDEEAVIGHVVSDLLASDLSAALRDVWVVADRCSDRTAEIAAAAGANVAARATGTGGKGAAIAWFLDRHRLGPSEAVVVLDADNRVEPGFLARMSDELDAGRPVVQAYLDVTAPSESLLTLASALSYWSANRMVHLAHSNLGWPVDLGGTGTCLTASALAAAGGFGDELVEDADLSTRLTLARVPTHWAHDVRVRDEKPADAGVAVRQRGRWLAGRRQIARRRVLPLLRHGLRTRRWGPIDQALRLVRPSRTIVAAASAAFAVTAALASWPGLLRWEVWAAVAVVQMLWPVPFLLRDRVPLRYVAALPILGIFAVMWAPIRLAAMRTRGWSRTPHRGAAPQDPGEESNSV